MRNIITGFLGLSAFLGCAAVILGWGLAMELCFKLLFNAENIVQFLFGLSGITGSFVFIIVIMCWMLGSIINEEKYTRPEG